MQKLHAEPAFISICLILKAAWGGGPLLSQQSHLFYAVVNVRVRVCVSIHLYRKQ